MNKTLLVVSVVFLLCTCPGASGTTWYVDGSASEFGDGSSAEAPLETIQEGIDAATGGDTVIVAEGTYVENVHFKGKNVILTSTDPLDPGIVAATIVDGNEAGSVVMFDGSEDETCLLSGFTIRNGSADYGGGICGGTWDDHTCAMIQNNRIAGNQTRGEPSAGGGLAFCDGTIQNNAISENARAFEWSYGGGLAYCHGTVENNNISLNSAEEGGGLYGCDGTIRNNTISANSGGLGGAFRKCRGTIQNNTITGNTANSGGALSRCHGTVENNTISENSASLGGGLYECHGTIQNNTIVKNSATWFGGGGLFRCEGIIRNNTIAQNSATPGIGGGGGGLILCNGTIENNLITGNSASLGGGLRLCDGTIQNNTITGNSAKHYGGGLSDCRGTIRNCIIWGNTAGRWEGQAESNTASFSCIQDWTGGGIGNIKEEPLFADAAGGDYRLRSTSPCVDAGADYYWFAWPIRDLDGNCRLAGDSVDMGCYEYGSSLDSDGDLLSDESESAGRTDQNVRDTDADGLQDGLEVLRGSDPLEPTHPRSVHVNSGITAIQESLCLAVNGDEVTVAPGRYRGNLHFCGHDVILRSLDSHDPDIVSSTIIDAGGSGSVVRFIGNESEACVLSGFTITGGASGGSGGGICGGMWDRHTHATIQNNVITENSAIGDYESGGGGVAYCDGIIENNTICKNSASEAWDGVRSRPIGGNGGGLARCDGTIQNNRITGNSISGVYTAYGAGLAYCLGAIRNNFVSGNSTEGCGAGLAYCDGAIQKNTIVANTADRGGGLYACNGAIETNIISSNSSSGYGGGLDCCNGIIQNNVISGNSASGWEPWYGYGGGLARCDGTISNNSVAANFAGLEGGGLYECEGMILNCIIWGNIAPDGAQLHDSSAPTYSCIENWSAGGEGNIDRDPVLLDPDGPDDDPNTYQDNDYHLQLASPCIDVGKNEEWMWEAVDLDGNPRVLIGISSLTVDMGAYEYRYPGVWYVDGAVPVSGNGLSWETAFKTIQEGIDAARVGDSVVVTQDTYAENIRFKGKNIVLRSTDPSDPSVVASTIIIDAGEKASVVTFTGAETLECLLLGFTIRNGMADYGGGICGGTRWRHTHATIRNNTITRNSAVYDGGGLAFCDGIIENNVISENRARDNGGGLSDCQGTIRNNTIADNSAFYSGGGLYWCHGTVEGNAISDNSAARGGGLDSCNGTIERNTITGNSVSYGGGGLAWCEGTVQGNLIMSNSAFYGGGLAWGEGIIQNNLIVGNWGDDRGGGLEGCDGVVRNNTIADNTAPDRGGGLADCDGTILNCIIWGNTAAYSAQLSACTAPTYSCTEEWIEGEGNFSGDPGFIDADGADDDAETYLDNDYRLAQGSPCIDAGKNEEWMETAVDLDGNRRILFGVFSLSVDIGAHEYGISAFRIVRIWKAAGGVELIWEGYPGYTYTIWSCLDLLTGEWIEEATLASIGLIPWWTDPDTDYRCKFYRIEIK